jgi:hypothetical protein
MTISSVHPDVGEVTYNRRRNAWVGSIRLPALKTFTSMFAADEDNYIPGQCVLYLQAERDDVPSAAAVALIERLVSNQEHLALAIASAMWDDFTGKGRPSGMYWHGHLDQVEDAYDSGLPPIDGPGAVFAWMRPDLVIVRHSGTKAVGSPIIEINFSAPFEIEHGVAVLTDGTAVLGI